MTNKIFLIKSRLQHLELGGASLTEVVNCSGGALRTLGAGGIFAIEKSKWILVKSLYAGGAELFLSAGEHCITTPTYHVFDMYKEHQGGQQRPVVLQSGKLSHKGFADINDISAILGLLSQPSDNNDGQDSGSEDNGGIFGNIDPEMLIKLIDLTTIKLRSM